MRLQTEDAGRGSTLKLWLLTVVIGCLLLSSLPCFSQEDESFQADVHGQKTWTVRYGLGDVRGLAQAGVVPYMFFLEQSLFVDIHGEALSMLTIDAHFNDQEPASMQSLTIGLDAGDLQGIFGDFSISGKEAFAVYNKKLKGVRLDYRIGEAQLTGILSQIEGISESRTFVGRTAHEEVLFSASPPGQPWLDQPYLRHIDGLYHYELEAPFVEGFSEVALAFDPSEGLQELLETYGLSYLFGVIAEEPSVKLSQGSFTVVSDAQDILLLKREPATLLRERLQDAITTYNEEEGLTGTEKKRYPFNEGTDYELAFLEQLVASVSIIVDGRDYPLAGGGRHRFYALGRTNVEEDSVVVEVSLDGGTFRPISDPDLFDYRVVIFPDEGIIELDFPESFFEGGENSVRVTFAYAVSGEVFMLGLSMVPGSEKVYLNGTLLERDISYSIDYELGALILFVEVGDEDTIRIDYERIRGGLGGYVEYARDFSGATLALPLSEALTLELSLLQAADSPDPVVDPATAHTMPNTHTVTGLVGSLRLNDFSADFTLGYAHNQFPLDDNLRVNLPNEVTAILALPDYTFVGHLNGVNVYKDGVWTGYDTSDGLSGNRVYDIKSDGTHVFFATSSGLTVLSLEGEAPLARVGNWRRYYIEDGLPHNSVQALETVEGTLWVGTQEGLASVQVEEIDEPSNWTRYYGDPFTELGSVVCLASDGEILYVGTEQGLFAFDEATETVSELSGAQSLCIYDLLLVERTLYVACEFGLRSFRDEVGTGWLVFGKPVYCLAFSKGALWYGTETGLVRSSAEQLLTGWEITEITSTAEGILWVGSRADTEYRLRVWEISERIEDFDTTLTGIDGRDRSRFADIPPEEHTDRGLLGRVSFQRDMGLFTLSGSFESVSPAFTSIGRLDRRDATGWDITGSAHPAEDLHLTGTHSFYLIDQASERPRSTMENRISLSWDFGPHLDASIQQKMVNDDAIHRGFENGSLSYSFTLRDGLFNDALSLSLHWNDAFNEDFLASTLTRENSLGLDGAVQVTPDLSVSASWSRPLTSVEDERIGSEKRALTVGWSHRFDTLNAGADYTVSASRAIPGEVFRTTQSTGLDLRFDRFGFLAWGISPSLGLNIEDKEGLTSLSGRGTLRAALDVFSVRATYSKEISGMWEQRQQQSDRLSISFEYLGFPDLRPILTYTTNSSAVIYQGEARPTFDHTLTGRLSWSPQGGPWNNLSISVHEVTQRDESTISATLNNAFSYSISDAISSHLDLEGNYAPVDGKPDFDLTLKGYVDVALSETWQASLATSYITGTESDGGLYHSLLFELFFATTF